MADLTTIERVEAGWRPLADPSQERTVALTTIGAASRLLRRLIPTIDDRINSGDLDEEFVSDIVAGAVIRVVRNPEGLREFAIDDYREVRNSDSLAGLLGFTDEELALLGSSGAATGSAFTIVPSGRGYSAPYGDAW